MATDGTHDSQENECTFQWDENSQLYYHASTGFYHEPQAGWYYSTIDGLYYKFEEGNYVLLDSNQGRDDQPDILNTRSGKETPEAQMLGEIVSPVSSEDEEKCISKYFYENLYPLACNSNNRSEYPPPPSQWLEDTLIDLYLSGCTNQRPNSATSHMEIPMPSDNGVEELEEGELIPDDPNFSMNISEHVVDEGISQEEENWRAQYGQVCQVGDDWVSDLKVVDLWDWALVRETKKDGKTEVAKLIGRLQKRNRRSHPSELTGGCKLKSAPVCEVYLDLVRVTSGRIYRLKVPSLQYLATLPVYDASYPTNDWGFPQLSPDYGTKKLPTRDSNSKHQSMEDPHAQMDKSLSSAKVSSNKKNNVYRNRAAERRALHGGFGVGPGQKKNSAPSSPTTEEAAAESLNISFGEGSYARKILENMGWREGETLGNSSKGLTEPLQAIGNKGNAGLGYAGGRRR